MIQKQKKPVRVGEGEQPKLTAKEVQKPDISQLTEKMKEAATKAPDIYTCSCGDPYCDSPKYDDEWQWIPADADEIAASEGPEAVDYARKNNGPGK